MNLDTDFLIDFIQEDKNAEKKAEELENPKNSRNYPQPQYSNSTSQLGLTAAFDAFKTYRFLDLAVFSPVQ